MRKYVYLHELDSVRKTDWEIIRGQQALYDEIVGNGNIVVLTYNQLVDSRGFFSLWDNPEYQGSLVELFQNGAIRISQYGSIRSIVQYLLSTIDNDQNRYIYSALPIKSAQKRLTALIKRSLIHSDLTEIREYLSEKEKNSAALRDLFTECSGDTIIESQLSNEEMTGILENLYWLLATVLRISTLDHIYVRPRENSEYRNFRFYDILKLVLDRSILRPDAAEAIRNLRCFQKGANSRSVYHHELKQAAEAFADKEAFQYAEAAVNLCYNCACEISICNISKHYDFCNIDSPDSSFLCDFAARLRDDWQDGRDANFRFLLDETNEFIEFDRMDALPNFSEAAFLTRCFPYQAEPDETGIPRYEWNLSEQRQQQKSIVSLKIGKKCLSLLFCIAFLMVFEIAGQLLQCIWDGEFSFLDSLSAVFGFAAETIAFFLICETASTLLSKKFPNLLSLSEAIQEIKQLLSTAYHVRTSKPAGYRSSSQSGQNFREKRSSHAVMPCAETQELRRYKQLRTKHPTWFAPSEIYPIADTANPEVVRSIRRSEELFSRQYGVVYQSRFHTFTVDPVIGEGGEIFPYERVMGSSGNDGVVMLTRHQGNFLLIRQFRHALRAEQLAFPRGFAEPGDSPAENAVRELREEIGAVLSGEPVLLGRIAPDSGLTGDRAYVFQADLKSFSPNIGHEGLLEWTEVPEEEFDRLISSGQIDDGFTLGAYALYRAYHKK